jgi:Excalibur calcium-binding domain
VQSSGPQKSRITEVRHEEPDAAKRLRGLREGFQRVSRRWDSASRRRKFYHAVMLWGVGAVGSFAVTWYFLSSAWPPVATLKHLAAFPNCDAARLVGLAPARKGEPGYWSRNDRDKDGIACEPWPPVKSGMSGK